MATVTLLRQPSGRLSVQDYELSSYDGGPVTLFSVQPGEVIKALTCDSSGNFYAVIAEVGSQRNKSKLTTKFRAAVLSLMLTCRDLLNDCIARLTDLK